jgi:hypothetical protein
MIVSDQKALSSLQSAVGAVVRTPTEFKFAQEVSGRAPDSKFKLLQEPPSTVAAMASTR